MNNRKYLTVTALSKYIRRKFDYDPYLKRVYLMGEISNYRYRPNAHQYFSLKDDRSKIHAVMFRSQFRHVKFRPEEGMKVLVSGRISVYEPQGSYQIYVDHMEPQGVGELYLAYEQLKRKLSREGLFDADHKKPLPKFPKRIAVITSQSGAVIRDIIVTTRRRYPIVQIVLYPAVVQGDSAKDDLVRQIKRVNASHDFDTLIIGRGGGSIEDLWPFNEEAVARAIYNSRVPVISSVGHETDTTIADLVADVRAATPTAAAELATPVLTDELQKIATYKSQIYSAFHSQLALLQQRLTKARNSYIFKNPVEIYDNYVQQVDQLRLRLKGLMQNYVSDYKQRLQRDASNLKYYSPRQKIVDYQQRIKLKKQTLHDLMQNVIAKKNTKFRTLVSSLNQLSPLKIMSHGYSYVTHNGQVVKDVHDVKSADQIQVNLHGGHVDAKVLKIVKNNKKGDR